MNRRRNSHRGFTLIEMIITVGIVGLLAAGVLPLAELAYKRTHEQELRLALREVRTAIDAYKTAVDQGKNLRRTRQQRLSADAVGAGRRCR